MEEMSLGLDLPPVERYHKTQMSATSRNDLLYSVLVLCLGIIHGDIPKAEDSARRGSNDSNGLLYIRHLVR